MDYEKHVEKRSEEIHKRILRLGFNPGFRRFKEWKKAREKWIKQI